MNEEVFVKQEADELTNRIASRLGERQQKLEQMAEWERQARPARLKPLYLTVAIAACIAAVFFFSPFRGSELSPLDELGIGTPTLTEYRAATPEMNEITQLMENGSYEAALEKTEEALKKSDRFIEELNEMADMWDEDEAIRYDEELEWAANSELRWTYIYLLVQQGHNNKAKKEIKRYLSYPEICEHETEARALLDKLKK